jgi:DNA polymerase I-like protein with 3'-5' exonuclease and polymerase domains
VSIADEFHSLDIETASNVQGRDYALESYRQGTKEARITSVAVAGPNGYIRQLHEREGMDGLPELLASLKGKTVWAHRAVFDVGWLIGATSFDLVKQIHWRDSSLLVKWLVNGQTANFFKYDLMSVVEKYVTSHPDLAEFLDIKRAEVTPGENYEYWLRRGRLDAIMTLAMVNKLWPTLPKTQYRGFVYEAGNIAPVADGWYRGLFTDVPRAKELKPKFAEHKTKMAASLKQPESMFTSNSQLPNYLFNVLKLPPVSKTPKGKPSCKKDDLNILADRLKETEYAPILKTILDFRKLATTESKFINGIINANEYNHNAYTHAFPNIFGTYTGRYTYASKTKKKWDSGIANHQLPRKGPIRKLLIAPPGYKVLELDGSQQELRFVTQFSRDENLIHEYLNDIDVHSSMSAYISGIPYEELQERYRADEPVAVNYRYAGKLLNLSCQYRIGAKSLAYKFFTTYGITVSASQAWRYLNLYKTRYKGVKTYWDDAIRKAKKDGYATSIADRRYKIKFWSEKYEYMSEQTAINHPIQGSGGDHKNLAISLLTRKFPEALFVLDLHDGLFFYVPEDRALELAREMRAYINATNWAEMWNTECVIPFPFEGKLGSSFGTVKPFE